MALKSALGRGNIAVVIRPSLRSLYCFLPSLMISTAAAAAVPQAVEYGEPVQVCILENKQIKESSGVACSRLNRGVFWTHNDSGDGPWVYAFNEKGQDLAQVTLTGVAFRDCEDMCSFTLKKVHYLLLADVGDNALRRKDYTLYLVREPKLDTTKRRAKLDVKPEVVIRYMYPDGPHNCESVAVDPVRKVILTVNKDGQEKHVYEIPLPDRSPRALITPKRIGTLKTKLPTLAMDISPDGQRAIILHGGQALIFTRGADEAWAKAFTRKPRTIKVPRRKQGESICYGPDGRTLFLTSEKLPTPLLKIPARQ